MHPHIPRSVGRRKTAVARVMLMPGSGKITINSKPLEKYFPLETLRADVVKPLAAAVALLMLVTCSAAVLLSEPAIRLVFGEPFLPAVPALLLLLPGLAFLSVSSVVSAYIASIDIPRVVVWIHAAAFALNLGLNLALLHRYGVLVASVNSSITYALSLLCLCVLVLTRMRPDVRTG